MPSSRPLCCVEVPDIQLFVSSCLHGNNKTFSGTFLYAYFKFNGREIVKKLLTFIPDKTLLTIIFPLFTPSKIACIIFISKILKSSCIIYKTLATQKIKL